MLTTKRKPPTVGEILVEEFMQPMGLTQAVLAEAMGVQRKHVNELCSDRRTVTATTALILASASGSNARRHSVPRRDPDHQAFAAKGKTTLGVRSSVLNLRATTDDDEHYVYAIAL